VPGRLCVRDHQGDVQDQLCRSGKRSSWSRWMEATAGHILITLGFIPLMPNFCLHSFCRSRTSRRLPTTSHSCGGWDRATVRHRLLAFGFPPCCAVLHAAVLFCAAAVLVVCCAVSAAVLFL
jgi:hypothetical protein